MDNLTALWSQDSDLRTKHSGADMLIPPIMVWGAPGLGKSTAVRELEANWVGSYKYLTVDEDVLRLQIKKSGDVVWTGYLANGRTFSGSTTLLHEDADLIRTPFAVTYAPAASVKASKKTPAVNYPVFCDIVKFLYDMPAPGSPAERSR